MVLPQVDPAGMETDPVLAVLVGPGSSAAGNRINNSRDVGVDNDELRAIDQGKPRCEPRC